MNSLSKDTPVETITEQTPKEQTEELATNSTDQPKTIVGGGRAATPPISAAPNSLFSIYYKNEDVIYFYCLFSL